MQSYDEESVRRGRLVRRLGCLVRLVLVVALLVAVPAIWVLVRMGNWVTVEPLEAGACRSYFGAPGAEDMEIDRATGTLILSADDRRARLAGEPTAVAGLFQLALKGEPETEPDIVPIEHDFEGRLVPHGIHLVEAGLASLLFVVNHGGPESDPHSVEIFRWQEGKAWHVRTVRHPLLISPNDVVGIDENRFYVTNDHGPGGPGRTMFDDLAGIGRGSVAYFEDGVEGETMRLVIEELAYPNGITLNPEQAYLYVASTTTGRIHVYQRDQETGDMAKVKDLETGTGVDNLEVDRYGGLWVAAHPRLIDFLRHSRDEDALSPSEVLWVDPAEDMDPPVRPVWRDLGEQLSGSSVALPYGSRFVIGSVFEPQILVCDRS